MYSRIVAVVVGVLLLAGVTGCGDDVGEPCDSGTGLSLSPGMWWVYETAITSVQRDAFQSKYRDSVVIRTSVVRNGEVYWQCDVFRDDSLHDTMFVAFRSSTFEIQYEALMLPYVVQDTLQPTFCRLPLCPSGPNDVGQFADSGQVAVTISPDYNIRREPIHIRRTTSSITQMGTTPDLRVFSLRETVQETIGSLNHPTIDVVRGRDDNRYKHADTSHRYTSYSSGTAMYSLTHGLLSVHVLSTSVLANYVLDRRCVRSSTGFRYPSN